MVTSTGRSLPRTRNESDVPSRSGPDEWVATQSTPAIHSGARLQSVNTAHTTWGSAWILTEAHRASVMDA